MSKNKALDMALSIIDKHIRSHCGITSVSEGYSLLLTISSTIQIKPLRM